MLSVTVMPPRSASPGLVTVIEYQTTLPVTAVRLAANGPPDAVPTPLLIVRLNLGVTVVLTRQFVLELPAAQSEPGTTTVLARVVVPVGQPPVSSRTLNVKFRELPAANVRPSHYSTEPMRLPPDDAVPKLAWARTAPMSSATVPPVAAALPVFWTVIV
jgi:hypothetical protein